MIDILRFKIICIGLFFFAPSGYATATGLVEALTKALNSNAQISAANINLQSQREEINYLRAQKKPTISMNFSGDRDWNLKNNDETNNFSAGLNAGYLLFDGNVTNYQISAESLRIKALEFEFEGIKQKVMHEAILAYLNVLRDTKLVQLSSKNVAVLKQQLEATKSRFQLGELTKTDVAQAQAALDSATSVLVSREGVLYLANRTFETAVGMKPIELETNIRLPNLPKTETAAEEEARKFNPDLKVSLLRERRAHFLLRVAKGRSLPTFRISSSLTGGETSSDQDFSNFGISLTGNLPFYTGGALQSGERKAQVDLELSMTNTELARLKVQQAVVSAWSDFQVSSAMIVARKREVEATDLAYRGTLEEARLGARTLLDVLNAEQTLMNAQTNLEIAKRNRLAAGFRLLLETGTLTPSIFGLEDI